MLRATLVSLLALNTVSAQSGYGRVVRPDSLVFRDSLVAAEKRFLIKWDSLWLSSESLSHSFSSISEDPGGGPRIHNFHCHFDVDVPGGAVSQGRLIRSDSSWFSVCPSWDLGDGLSADEERISIDTVLRPQDRAIARAERSRLLSTLDSAARLRRSDDFILGQRVRFLVDQRDLAAALRLAHDCGATQWWCDALAGYARAARGEIAQAETEFATAVAAMPREERCRWTDYHMLVDSASQKKYGDASCGGPAKPGKLSRDSLNERLWWLSDPLFIEPGNERRVEQNARMVLLALRTAVDRDERYSWNWKIGNDARYLMVEKYGWPSYSYWAGPIQEKGHTGYLGAHGSPPNEHYASYEFNGPRSHLVPAWTAIADPFRSVPGDWDMSPPDPREYRPPPRPVAAPVTQLYAPAPPRDTQPKFWWPVEHFQPHDALAQLPDGQQAMLRRKDGALLAVATDLGALRLGRRDGDTVSGITLVTSTGPGDVQRFGVSRGIVGGSFEMHALIPSSPAVAGLEFLAGGPSAPVAGRMRFGIAPPSPLSALHTGEMAVSDPVLLRVPTNGRALPNDPESALKLMATSHVVSRGGQLGVYWESYGFNAADSVEVAVWIERYTSQGIARRFGIAMRIATDLNTPVSMGWSEPQPGHSANVFADGGVTVIGRSVALDVSGLAPGDYRLEVAVRKPGKPEPVRGRTTFIVKP
jgi:hypothetical protein